MTEEEIKNLKIGDKFTMEYAVREEDRADVDMPILAESNDGTFLWVSSLNLKHATLVKPAPTFEVGDTVRIVPDPLTRTIYGQGKRMLECEIGEIGKITVSCIGSGDFSVKTNDGAAYIINVHCLELVKKAVKDKYVIKEHYVGGALMRYVIEIADNKEPVATFVLSNHPDAKAAAEAECDRLNAEWRKQQLTNNK